MPDVLIYFMFSDLRQEVVVCFVDIGWIVDHHYYNYLLIELLTIIITTIYWYWLNCWSSLLQLSIDIGWIVDYHYYNYLLILVELLTIIIATIHSQHVCYDPPSDSIINCKCNRWQTKQQINGLTLWSIEVHSGDVTSESIYANIYLLF